MIRTRLGRAAAAAIFAAGLSSTAVAAESAVNASTPTLSLSDAVARAVRSNVDVRVAQAKTTEQKGKALQDASRLLPQLVGSVSQDRVFRVNLAASGFPAGGPFPTLLGPYNSFDARLTLRQSVIDVGSIFDTRAGHAAVASAKAAEDLARESVAAAAALAYVETAREERSQAAAQAEVDLASSLLSLAQDQHRAGLSTGVDVARAETRRAQANLRLVRSRTAERQASIRLCRVVGIPFDPPPVLADVLLPPATDQLDLDASLAAARSARPEIRIANADLREKEERLNAKRSGHLPTASVYGSAGESGTQASDARSVSSIGARIDLPILAGGHVVGESEEIRGQRDAAKARLDDVDGKIQEDVSLAIESLSAEREEVTTADQAARLAAKELQMAKDRYAAGVGDNIQLISAENAVAQAQEDLIDALARYRVARVNFEMALGRARTIGDE